MAGCDTNAPTPGIVQKLRSALKRAAALADATIDEPKMHYAWEANVVQTAYVAGLIRRAAATLGVRLRLRYTFGENPGTRLVVVQLEVDSNLGPSDTYWPYAYTSIECTGTHVYNIEHFCVEEAELHRALGLARRGRSWAPSPPVRRFLLDRVLDRAVSTTRNCSPNAIRAEMKEYLGGTDAG